MIYGWASCARPNPAVTAGLRSHDSIRDPKHPFLALPELQYFFPPLRCFWFEASSSGRTSCLDSQQMDLCGLALWNLFYGFLDGFARKEE